ncbi:Queuosine biosynthesis protein [Magnetococcus marinus MC-1]|uniref:S-adenosylmethionine:tRNA ribosyltransferase-isomerase n=1 Tax=Magnetococcus marinus (strain ATCC BAA-1437 / JCM 17883 / MC-1) TaxID=156889 RepID=QUEA_MAGMM|nr:tRNA preQ1(34) S-adenosylmethionine ribosyltransferase-isomerase QueA [Magnetococcus marinus]A0L579.1 RecName: Full=S-adenosylmethionine:tRNA ribosyltransferase-isomerase; AltName: Full=Queuosine biosynthesis protein QueA [Magnetococcus marinus MC-1]ABK43122.1 Queuosine biosynthesis protein [Magnetococcus marinus MC-1]
MNGTSFFGGDGTRLSHYDYDLPAAHIAQRPMEPRDHARLLVSRAQGVEDSRFDQLVEHLQAGDLLVLNDTKVIPARLLGHKPSGGRVEIFLLKPDPQHPPLWRAMTRSNKPLKVGQRVEFGEDFYAELVERQAEGHVLVALHAVGMGLDEAMQHYGQMPLPPYISGSDAQQDKSRYQTVFARRDGAVAAPTAGLHFTDALFERLAAKGVTWCHVTLHVGLGTFQPVRVEDLDAHPMHGEWRQLEADAVAKIQRTKAAGGRVVAVGTTAVRTLESSVDDQGVLQASCGETRLFIRPGYRFKVVDLMLTNFHLPKSTLLMLVAAFVGRSRLRRDYAHAMGKNYRFYSYGDTTLLYPQLEEERGLS